MLERRRAGVWNIAKTFVRNVRSSSSVADVGEPVASHLVRRVVDEDVDAAELPHGALDDRPAVAGVLEIARQLERGPAGLVHGARGLVGVALLGFEVGDRDVGALAGERERDGAADARVTARHEGLATLSSLPVPR